MKLHNFEFIVCLHGGVFHLCGHSREVDAFDAWPQLDGFLRYAAARIPAERRLSNREVLAASRREWRLISSASFPVNPEKYL